MREIVKESKRIMRQAGREFIRQRLQLTERQDRRETDAEIRAALRGAGIELAEVSNAIH